MLTHPTHGRLVALGLAGMAKALDEQRRQPDISMLAFEERLALLVDREATERENKRLVSRLRFASLRQNAVVEDINMRAPRGLEKALFQKLIANGSTAPIPVHHRPDRPDRNVKKRSVQRQNSSRMANVSLTTGRAKGCLLYHLKSPKLLCELL
jgi:hypothetical protein